MCGQIGGAGVAGADGGAAGQEGQGLGRTAVIAQRGEHGCVAEDVVRPGCGVGRGVVDGRAQQVVAVVGGDAAFDVGIAMPSRCCRRRWCSATSACRRCSMPPPLLALLK